MLAVLFGTFAAPQRLKALLPLCQRWSVRMPRGAGAGCDQDVCRVVIGRLAAKVCGVIKKSVSGDSIEGGLRTMSLSEGAFIGSDGALRLRRFSVERAGLLGDYIGEVAFARRPCPRRRRCGGWRRTRLPPLKLQACVKCASLWQRMVFER
ncbi:putative receptor-type adenylate cyclase [Trypanosoma cruzi]|uniref:Putative receptor-type adenylate cyclase n=1 Tax=Trypanosoma cruzi TaxID=5693 RepID=A0A2V2WIW2_TRYCR|nr:putative receptor-type adenylate cyclase [Trypanosoma cruzi]